VDHFGKKGLGPFLKFEFTLVPSEVLLGVEDSFDLLSKLSFPLDIPIRIMLKKILEKYLMANVY
jgi:hypothetical protein